MPNWGDRKVAGSIPTEFVCQAFLFFRDFWTCARMRTHLPGLACYDRQIGFDFFRMACSNSQIGLVFLGSRTMTMRRTAFVGDGMAPQFVSMFVCHHAGTARNTYRNSETVIVFCVQCHPKPLVCVAVNSRGRHGWLAWLGHATAHVQQHCMLDHPEPFGLRH